MRKPTHFPLRQALEHTLNWHQLVLSALTALRRWRRENTLTAIVFLATIIKAADLVTHSRLTSNTYTETYTEVDARQCQWVVIENEK